MIIIGHISINEGYDAGKYSITKTTDLTCEHNILGHQKEHLYDEMVSFLLSWEQIFENKTIIFLKFHHHLDQIPQDIEG